MPVTYTNAAQAINQPLYANGTVNAYSDANPAAFTGVVTGGSLAGYFYQLAGTSLYAQDQGDANVTWVEVNDASQTVSTFFIYGDLLFALPNGSFLSISQPTTLGLQNVQPGNAQGSSTAPGAAGSGTDGTGGGGAVIPLVGGGGQQATGGGAPATALFNSGSQGAGGGSASGQGTGSTSSGSAGTGSGSGSGSNPFGLNLASLFSGSGGTQWLLIIAAIALVITMSNKKSSDG